MSESSGIAKPSTAAARGNDAREPRGVQQAGRPLGGEHDADADDDLVHAQADAEDDHDQRRERARERRRRETQPEVPVSRMATKPTKAPASIMPSSPTLSTPACSATISPRLANSSGTPAAMPLEQHRGQELLVEQQVSHARRLSSSAEGAMDSPRARLSRQVLRADHEQQQDAHEQEHEVARASSARRAAYSAADREQAEERRERDQGQRVHASQEHERHDGQPVRRVPVGAHVAEDALDVDRGGEADERAADEERDDDEARHVDAHVDRGPRRWRPRTSRRVPNEVRAKTRYVDDADEPARGCTPTWMLVSGRSGSIASRGNDVVWGTASGPSNGPLTSITARLMPMKDIISVVTISLIP